MQLLIPAAGAGSRFKAAGYTVPKPLLPVDGVPMVEHVYEDVRELFGQVGKAVVVFQKGQVRPDQFKDLKVRYVDELTQGALETCLSVESEFDPTEPLLVCNSDQAFSVFEPYNFRSFIGTTREVGRGVVLCFQSDGDPKWSYVVNGRRIVEKPDKAPDGNCATIGAYYFHYAHDFFAHAKAMLAANERHGPNQEFYVAPVMNRLPCGFDVWYVDDFHGLGTPQDYQDYCGVF